MTDKLAIEAWSNGELEYLVRGYLEQDDERSLVALEKMGRCREANRLRQMNEAARKRVLSVLDRNPAGPSPHPSDFERVNETVMSGYATCGNQGCQSRDGCTTPGCNSRAGITPCCPGTDADSLEGAMRVPELV